MHACCIGKYSTDRKRSLQPPLLVASLTFGPIHWEGTVFYSCLFDLYLKSFLCPKKDPKDIPGNSVGRAPGDNVEGYWEVPVLPFHCDFLETCHFVFEVQMGIRCKHVSMCFLKTHCSMVYMNGDHDQLY